jgi:hypothetical protein
MAITEPATLVTDYLLAAFTIVLAWRLFRAARASRSMSQWWWAVAFLATAIAGVAGGTVHGFRLVLPAGVTAALWILTLEALVVAAFAVVRGTLAGSQLAEGAKRAASWTAAVLYAGYGLWVASNPRFVFAIAAYGVALVVLVAFNLIAWRADRHAARWMIGGVIVSTLAAAVQQSGWSIHQHFNHNDLYHVIQAVAIWLLYRGVQSSKVFACEYRDDVHS